MHTITSTTSSSARKLVSKRINVISPFKDLPSPPPLPQTPDSLRRLKEVLKESEQNDKKMEEEQEEFDVWRALVLLPALKRKRGSSE
ncbi:hypothetical protein VNI00_007157, partial [Paramarasmius palmivorus]